MSDFDELLEEDFGFEGALERPTMRGSANLNQQDYQGFTGRSEILDDELQEMVPSTPGRYPGAAAATDVEGTSDFDMLEVPGGMDTPGMKQTTYGAYPWGPGSNTGYRPFSQQRTDMSLRALGDETDEVPEPPPMERDDMAEEPEVINAVAVQEPLSWEDQWHGQRNQQPSNAEVDPMTIYDRTSYEFNDSSQNVIGAGIFDMEEGVTWRPRDGSFRNQYAVPAYIGAEDELGVQQSAMWDSTADEWRVTQPSGGGISLARPIDKWKPSPFPEMRPEVTGPRSHIEAFGRKAAKSLVTEAKQYRAADRGKFLSAAMDALGPGGAARCKKAADMLSRMGYRPDVALEDAMAHCIMHAAVKDLTQKSKNNASALPRLDKMASQTRQQAPQMRQAAGQHLAPLTANRGELRKDLGALHGSPAAAGIGAVAEGAAEAPAAPKAGLLTTRNIMIGAGVGLGAWLLFSNRKAIAKNIKKLVK